MKINLALWDRVLRYVLGFLMLTWAFAGGAWWAYFGVVLIATAAWGVCPFFVLAGVRTYRDKPKKS